MQKVIKCLSSKQSGVFSCLEEKQTCGTRAELIHFLIPELNLTEKMKYEMREILQSLQLCL